MAMFLWPLHSVDSLIIEVPIMEVINHITENFDNYLEIALQLVGLASLIAAMAPKPKYSKALKKARKVLDYLAANFGNAKNKDD